MDSNSRQSVTIGVNQAAMAETEPMFHTSKEGEKNANMSKLTS